MVLLKIISKSNNFRHYADETELPVAMLTSALDEEKTSDKRAVYKFHSVSFLIAPCESNEFHKQVTLSIDFLEKNHIELNQLILESDPIDRFIKFHTYSPITVTNSIQNNIFPIKLISICNKLGLGIEIQSETKKDEVKLTDILN